MKIAQRPRAYCPSPFALRPSPFVFRPSPFALRPSSFLLALLVLGCAVLGTANAQDVLGLNCGPTLLAVRPGGTATLTVTVDTPPAADLTVNLMSDDPTVAGVPDTITIRAGETSASVTVSGIARGNTFVTASTDTEASNCSVYVAPPLSNRVIRFPAQMVRVTVLNPPTLMPAVRVRVGPPLLPLTQPVKVTVRAPAADESSVQK
jgi:hypothetical protein